MSPALPFYPCLVKLQHIVGMRFAIYGLRRGGGGVMPLASATAQSDLSSVQGSNSLTNFTQFVLKYRSALF